MLSNLRTSGSADTHGNFVEEIIENMFPIWIKLSMTIKLQRLNLSFRCWYCSKIVATNPLKHLQAPTWTGLKPFPQSFKMCNMHFSEVLVKAAYLVSRTVCLAFQVRAFASRFNVSFVGLDLHLASCKNNTTCIITSLNSCYAFMYGSFQRVFYKESARLIPLPVLLWLLFHKIYVFNLTFL